MQNTLQDVSERLLELYQDAQQSSPVEFQQSALATMQELVPYDYAVLGGGWASGRRITELTVVGQPHSLLTEWTEVSNLDPFCDLTLKHINRTWRFDDIDNYRDSLAYNEHWRRFDVKHMMSTILTEPLDGYVSFIGLCRHKDSHAFNRDTSQFKQTLMPHFTQALRINRHAYLDKLSAEGLALADRTGLIKASRGIMNILMRDAWHQKTHFPEHVMASLQERGTWYGDSMHLTSTPLGPYLLIQAEIPRPLVMHMTPREVQVATLFSQGKTHKEVARELGISPATVRNQLARIYEKLGVHNKVELVTRMAPKK